MGTAWLRHGSARLVRAWLGLGKAWHGSAGLGVSWLGSVRRGAACHGAARWGSVGHGWVRQGPVRSGRARHGTDRHGSHSINGKRDSTMTLTIEPIALDGVSDSGNATIALGEPYRVSVEITGDAALLFHRWQSDAVEAKAKAAKGSTAKKTDDIETYVWRNETGEICLPGEYLRGSLVDRTNGAAKYLQDPRSPRKSALDLWRASIQSLTDLAPIIRADGSTADAWDYIDRRRALVQRNAITRERPALLAGWSAEILLLVTQPHYIDARLLHRTLCDAGRLVGVGDFRPTFGRFSVSKFEILA